MVKTESFNEAAGIALGKSNRKDRATINDVAAKAGVSIKTVSRVVNNEANVRADTRESVQKVIDQLDYRPNASARRLAGSRSHLFALVYEDPSNYENASANYVTNLQGGALSEARKQGYDLVLHPCDYSDPNVAKDLAQLIEHARIDGLLLAPPMAELRAVVKMLRRSGKPIVRISPGHVRGFDAVNTNDREVCSEMAQYLVSLGHRRIAFIKGHSDHRAMVLREHGLLDGLKQAGVKPIKSYIVQGDNSFESGAECTRKLMRLKNRPTAIFAANDDMAAGVLQAAHTLDINVPLQLSVAGFDDVPLSRQVWPQLTTIHQPTFALGEMAARRLFMQIGGGTLDSHSMIPSTLVIRDSTVPPMLLD